MRAPVKLRRPVAATALGLALLAGAVGCGSSSSSSDSSTTTAPASSTSAPAASGGSDDSQALMSLLLTASEVGPGFTAQAPATKPPSTGSSLCGTPAADVDFPPTEGVAVTMSDAATKVAFEEQINSYPSEVDAIGALAVATAGLSCGRATTSGGEELTVSGPIDLTSQVGAKATSWNVTSSTRALVLIGVQDGNAVLLFSFQGPDGATVAAVDSVTIAQVGVAKFMAG